MAVNPQLSEEAEARLNEKYPRDVEVYYGALTPRLQNGKWINVGSAADGDEYTPWVTYRMADGSLVWGEYEWVTELEFFDGDDEPTRLIQETWVLVAREEVIVNVPEHEDTEAVCAGCGQGMGVKIEEDEEERTFCSEDCWEADRAGVMADRARDEAKFDE